jgi:Zn-dependent oligopeptidase
MNHIRFNYSIEEINKIKNDIINTNEDFISKMNTYTPNNLLETYLYSFSKYDYIYETIIFLQSVLPDSNIKNASIKFQEDLMNYFLKFYKNENNYKILLKLKSIKNKNSILNKVLKDIFKSFENNGINLDINKRNKLEILKKDLNKYESQFMQNIYNDKKKLIISKETSHIDLDGVNKDFLNSHYDKSSKKYIIGITNPEQEEIVKYCNSSSTRKIYSKIINNIGYKKNINILQKILILRYKISNILGYKNNIDYTLSYDRIAKENQIYTLLNKLIPKLKKMGNNEYNTILNYFVDNINTFDDKIKSNVLNNIVNNNNVNKGIKKMNNKINKYDFSYFSNIYKEKHYGIDTNIIKKYFPLSYTINRVFKMYEKIFSIKFERIKNVKKSQIWYKDVILYRVVDKANNNANKKANNNKSKNNIYYKSNKRNKSNKNNKSNILGYLYLDLFPRPNKYNHAATFDLQPSYINKYNKRVLPITAIVCNFDRKFFTHDTLTTFCHEMGHALHNLFSKVKYVSLSGTKTELDFVETISQFFENWCWEKDFLKYVSRNIKTKKPLSDELIHKIIKTKKYNNGIHYLTQILYIKYDLGVHKKENYTIKELHDLWFNISNELLPFFGPEHNHIIKEYNDNIFPMCSFGHLIGYDVGYYSYLWSIIYSYDIFSKFQKNGLFSNKVGMDLRRKIMEKGATKNGVKLLTDFLQRKPSYKYFLENVF